MLLSDGQNPTTNATIIPGSVIDMVSTGVSVVSGNAYALIPTLQLGETPTFIYFRPAPELSPPVYGGGVVQYSYRGHGACSSRSCDDIY
jgi:hypothetical protein